MTAIERGGLSGLTDTQLRDWLGTVFFGLPRVGIIARPADTAPGVLGRRVSMAAGTVSVDG